ncbi:MAG: hypothetical protein Tp136SUR676911_53 [Prokaryotic dsDNA virus sp.]|jgi:hypothetical protein|nr:MAG: hypothetical protein Tp136SUR676911_53 [Prokaryotic dsDNA virus sp.]|tara:strand:+ start:32914 stop:33189 length:276 start_codon:yes stop_codon:yes gene_type:complete
MEEDTYTHECGIKPCENAEDWERCGVDVSDFVLSVTQTDNKIISVEVRSAKRDKTIAAAEHAIELQTNEPANSTHLGILYDAGLLTPNNAT